MVGPIRPRRVPKEHKDEFPDIRTQGTAAMGKKIWILDGNIFETAALPHIKQIVQRGNFAIGEDVVNEIMDWPKEPEKQREALRIESQSIVKDIKKNHNDKIFPVDRGKIFAGSANVNAYGHFFQQITK